MMRKVAICAALAASTLAMSQNQQEGGSAAPAMPGPAQQMKAMAIFLGSWTGSMRMTYPGMPVTDYAVTVHEEEYGGGTFHKTHYTLKAPSMPDFEGMIFTTFNPKIGRYHAWTFETATPEPREETGAFADGKLVMTSKPHGGLVTRSTFAPDGKDAMTLTIEMAPPAMAQQQIDEKQKKWVVMGVAKLKRKS